jgi:cell division protein FtsQ
MMPDVEPLLDTEGTAPGETDADPSDEIDPEKTPDVQPPSPEPPTVQQAVGRHDRLRKIVAIAFIATVLLGAAAVTLTRSPFFYARTLEVRGASHVVRTEILRIAAITNETNVFTLDADASEVRLEGNPWIAEATITKDLPSRLVIDIDERVAVAVVESGGVLRLVADDGALLEAALPRVAAGLPVIASTDEQGLEPGADAVEGAARAIDAMAPSLRRRIDGVSILADGQLRVDLSSGAEVAYGEAVDLPEKAMALRALLDYAAENRAWVISADVRVPSAPTAVLSGGVALPP